MVSELELRRRRRKKKRKKGERSLTILARGLSGGVGGHLPRAR
jgi:hypothetical protein